MTVEHIHSNYLKQFDIIKKINTISEHTYDIEKVENMYILNTILSLSEYYSNNNSQNYMIEISTNNYNKDISNVISFFGKTNNKQIQELIHELKKLNQIIPVPQVITKCIYCNLRMLNKSNMFICTSCGYCLKNCDNYKCEYPNIATSYNQSKHVDRWICRIQGIEKDIIPHYCINKIANYIKKKHIKKTELNCFMFREILKQTKLTRYNTNMTKILNILGVKAKKLTTGELKYIKNISYQVIVEYDIIKDNKNLLYIPYIIYKLIEFKLRDGKRKNKILSYIHLQQRSTLIKNDQIWELICKKLDIIYKPTERILS